MLAKRFRLRIVGTLMLVVLESVAFLLFPLVLGLAIDDLIGGERAGLIALFALTVVALAIATGRRFYDTRAYASVYRTIAAEMVEREHRDRTPVSKISARATLLVEFVEFLEESLPMIIGSAISIVGAVLILLSMHTGVGVAAVGLIVLVALVYLVTMRANTRFNASYNDELERQVHAIESESVPTTIRHFRDLMRWRVNLSDLETFNYAAIFIGVIGLLIYSPVALVDESARQGAVFAGMMYVFQYIEDVLHSPLYLQQLIRLDEIAGRLGRTRPAPSGDRVELPGR
ncbi:MAG: ABC transporter six-transmembrane domain-containing protein [Planctomycetota bacterium]